MQASKATTMPNGWYPMGVFSADFRFRGVAPLSRVVSLKVADSVGAIDVSQVIAAIDWAVRHRNDNGLNIRVINLSYGVTAYDDWKNDALSYAVEQAWMTGIVVIASAGNGGRLGAYGTAVRSSEASGLSSPAYNSTFSRSARTTRRPASPTFRARRAA